MQPIIIKEFPLEHIQCGAPLGNSLLGVLIWGGGRKINITFGSNSVWDHRGGLPWSSKINFADIKKALENCDECSLRDIFALPEYPANTPPCPQVVPMGRLTLLLEEDCELLRYELHLQNSLLDIVYTQGGTEKKITFLLGRKSQKRLVFCGGNIKNICWQDSWHLSNERKKNNVHTLQDLLFPEPEHFLLDDVQGFRQMLPADPGFALAFRQDADTFTVGFARGDEEIAALNALMPVSWDTLLEENNTFWQNIYSRTPELAVDNAILMEMYHFGLYKFISMSDPSGVPAGLQGPWIEDDRFPPWSADYHFNINVQMCYSPALRANLAENLMPLFDMIRSWQEKLRNNAQNFVNVEDGILMPHAVDDRGTCMGGFWTGAIDHGCSAWTAQMMFDYCDYTGNMDFLREFVFDFMRGVFNVFRAMMSTDADGKLRLPLSVSPEYRGSNFDAWGANASFQLAAVHRLIRNLCQAAEWLGQQPEPGWLDTAERLPEITVTAGLISEVVDRNLPEIALWENQPLEYSHRHHSHLAAIAPFNTIDPWSNRAASGGSLTVWATGQGGARRGRHNSTVISNSRKMRRCFWRFSTKFLPIPAAEPCTMRRFPALHCTPGQMKLCRSTAVWVWLPPFRRCFFTTAAECCISATGSRKIGAMLKLRICPPPAVSESVPNSAEDTVYFCKLPPPAPVSAGSGWMKNANGRCRAKVQWKTTSGQSRLKLAKQYRLKSCKTA